MDGLGLLMWLPSGGFRLLCSRAGAAFFSTGAGAARFFAATQAGDDRDKSIAIPKIAESRNNISLPGTKRDEKLLPRFIFDQL
jgi:hypothetical protein